MSEPVLWEERLKALSPADFERLIQQLLTAKFPGIQIQKVNGSGGDQGIDSFQGDLSDGPAIWQCKHFKKGLGFDQKKQIVASIKTAFLHQTPVRWTLCVNVDLRTREHKWFETFVQKPNGGSDRIKLIQASEIISELLINRKLRDFFFSDNAISELRQMAALFSKTGGLSLKEKEEKSRFYDYDFRDGLAELDHRFDAIITTGPLQYRAFDPIGIPGLVLTTNSPDKTVQYIVRNIGEYNQSPIALTTTFADGIGPEIHNALQQGRPLKIKAGSIVGFRSNSSLFNYLLADVDPRHLEIRLKPALPRIVTDRTILIDLIAGCEASGQVLSLVPFKVARFGTTDVTFKSDGFAPLDIEISLPHSPSAGVTFPYNLNLTPNLSGTNAVNAHKAIQFLEELATSGRLEMRSKETGGTMMLAEFELNLNEFIPQDSRDVVRMIATVAEHFAKHVILPSEISTDEKNGLSTLVSILTGQDLTGPFKAFISKPSNLPNALKDAFEGKTFNYAENSRDARFNLFDYSFDVGSPFYFQALDCYILQPDATKERYLRAKDGEQIAIEFEVKGTARYALGFMPTSSPT